MKPRQLIKTSNFRLSALYLALILLSFAVLGTVVYFLTGGMLRQELRNNVTDNIEQLQSDYKVEGLQELITDIHEKEDVNVWNAPAFALIDLAGKRVAGSLPRRKYTTGWQVFGGSPESNDPGDFALIYADAQQLPNGYWLVAGEDGEFIDDFGQSIIEAFGWSALLVIVLGIPCSLLLSRSFLRKIESLTRSTQAIIDGDLSHRLAVSPSNDELDGLAQIINSMLDQINSLVEKVQQVSNDIAHDLRTPISRLRQRLEESQDKSLSATEYREQTELAKLELDTILATFSALLRIAHIEARSRRSGFKMLSFTPLLRNVVDAFLPVAEETGKKLSLAIKNDVTFSGDYELLTQLVFNLIENALQYTGEDGCIEIELDFVDGKIFLIVRDNGPGIDAATKGKVFQRFYRVEQSRNTPGNGLGLSIAQAVAELHSTKIELFDNNPGLKVVVAFPC